MALRLGEFGDMHKGRHLLGAGDFGSLAVGQEQGGVIPAADGVDVEAVAALSGRAAEALEQLGDVFLGDLVLVGDRDAVAIIINGDDGGDAQHADRINRFPKQAFGGGSVADGGEDDLLAIFRELGEAGQLVYLAIELGGIGQANGARHLRGGRRDIRGRVGLGGQVLPVALLVQAAGAEMGVHHPPGGSRIGGGVGMSVKLGEKLLQGGHPSGQGQGLVAVIARAPIAGLESVGHGDLRQLLAVAEDAELGLAAHHFTAADQAGLAAAVNQAVIVDDLLGGDLQVGESGRDQVGGDHRRLYPALS